MLRNKIFNLPKLKYILIIGINKMIGILVTIILILISNSQQIDVFVILQFIYTALNYNSRNIKYVNTRIIYHVIKLYLTNFNFFINLRYFNLITREFAPLHYNL